MGNSCRNPASLFASTEAHEHPTHTICLWEFSESSAVVGQILLLCLAPLLLAFLAVKAPSMLSRPQQYCHDNVSFWCREVAEFQAKSFGCSAEVNWEMYYPPTINARAAYELVRDVYSR